jgi:hypothetical protein
MADATTFGKRFAQTVPEALRGQANERQYNARSVKENAYKALVICSDQNIVVDAWLPETVGVDVNATYDTPYAQGLGGVNERLGAFAQFIGMNLTTQALTAQIWQGGAFINFQLPFVFHAENSAELDVMEPIKKLLRLTMPKDPSGGGILEAPGPHVDIKKLAQNGGTGVAKAVQDFRESGLKTMIDTAKKTLDDPLGTAVTVKNAANNVSQRMSQALVNSVVNNISLYIGQFLYFPSVVVTDVSPTFDVTLDSTGKPTRATVDVSFRTFYVPTQNDIELMFPNMVASNTSDLRGSRLG